MLVNFVRCFRHLKHVTLRLCFWLNMNHQPSVYSRLLINLFNCTQLLESFGHLKSIRSCHGSAELVLNFYGVAEQNRCQNVDWVSLKISILGYFHTFGKDGTT